jgi:hypothetical protein
MRSDLFKLNLRDLLHGFIVAIVSSVLTGLYTVAQTGQLPTLEELKVVGLVGLGAGLSYLGKQLTTNADGNFGSSDPK